MSNHPTTIREAAAAAYDDCIAELIEEYGDIEDVDYGDYGNVTVMTATHEIQVLATRDGSTVEQVTELAA